MQGERGKDWRTTHGKQGTAWCKHFSHNKTFRYGQAGASLGRKESFPRVENNFPSRGEKLFLGREIWLSHHGLQGTEDCVRIFPIRTRKPMGLAHLASALDLSQGGSEGKVAVVVDGGEYHATALLAHHLPRGEVGYA